MAGTSPAMTPDEWLNMTGIRCSCLNRQQVSQAAGFAAATIAAAALCNGERIGAIREPPFA